MKEVSRISKDEAHFIITVRDSWEGQIEPAQSAREYKIVMKRQDGKWLLDDFDDKYGR